MGGEKLAHSIDNIDWLGSPPHGRGKDVVFDEFIPERRITPAWAGKRPWMPSDSSSSRDHPRVGGEKNVLGIHLPSKVGSPRVGGEKPAGRFLLRLDTGSPPRGRGKDSRRGCRRNGSRITPAWAGKSVLPTRHCQIPKDHPRVGGEKLCLVCGLFLHLGSPPRRRGKEAVAPFPLPAAGITPA